MFGPFVDAIERFVTDFTWRRLFIWGGFVAFIVTTLYFFESYTDYFKMQSLERRTHLIEEIVNLEHRVAESKYEKLKNSYIDVIEELETHAGSVGSEFNFWDILPQWAKRVLTAVLPWIFIGVLMIWTADKSERKTIVLGLILFASVVGLISTLLPNSWSGNVVYIYYPIGGLVLPVTGLLLWQSKTQ